MSIEKNTVNMAKLVNVGEELRIFIILVFLLFCIGNFFKKEKIG